MSGTFQFHPELFESRGQVIEALDDAGFQWLGGYSCVDVLHDEYGIEICGIDNEDDVEQIERVVSRLFPDWCVGRCLRDWSGGDQGWCVRVCRDPDIEISERMLRQLEKYFARKRARRRTEGFDTE